VCYGHLPELQEQMEKAYGEGVTIPKGLLAELGSQGTSLLAFTGVMAALLSGSIYIMN